MRSKIIALLVILSMFTTGCSTITVPNAKEAAIFDTITTVAVLGSGTGHELNPVSFVGATLAKAVILSNIDRFQPETQDLINKTTATIWTAAAVNNLAVVMCVPLTISLPLTLAAGYVVYKNTPKTKKDTKK
jgi:PBP1b-binding outer membrane lipoprotein LpoB